MSERVLVTGGSGFIGRRLVRHLREQGAEVYAPERSALDVTVGPLPELSVDFVIHLAGRTFVPASWNEPADFYRVNVLGTVNVLEYCRQKQAHLLYVSGYAYGIPDSLPISEDAPLKPNNPYAFSKRSAEAVCHFYYERLQTRVTIARPFNIYGPGQSADFLIPHILKQVVDPAVAAVEVEDDTPRRDYVHVDDVIGAIERLRANPKPGAVFNIGSGESYSVAEIAEIACRAAGISKPVVSRGNQRVNDISDVVADISAIRNAVGWSPSITLLDGLCEIITNDTPPNS